MQSITHIAANIFLLFHHCDLFPSRIVLYQIFIFLKIKYCYLRGPHLKPPKSEQIFVAVITFPPLSFVLILLLSTCCLLCVLDDM